MATLRAQVTGRVQGVGFRFFVLGAARRIGVTGLVRNLPDKAVEVEAHGSREQLDELITVLRQGPPLSRVDAVEIEHDAELEPAERFEIRGAG